MRVEGRMWSVGGKRIMLVGWDVELYRENEGD